jgi:hypothetical protein
VDCSLDLAHGTFLHYPHPSFDINSYTTSLVMVGSLTAGQCKSLYFIGRDQILIFNVVAIYGDIKRVLNATGGYEIAKVKVA